MNKRFRITIAEGRCCFWNGEHWLVYWGSFEYEGRGYVVTLPMYDRTWGLLRWPIDWNSKYQLPVKSSPYPHGPYGIPQTVSII